MYVLFQIIYVPVLSLYRCYLLFIKVAKAAEMEFLTDEILHHFSAVMAPNYKTLTFRKTPRAPLHLQTQLLVPSMSWERS
jgi:hypothetical protein